jgi:hypothetical protein
MTEPDLYDRIEKLERTVAYLFKLEQRRSNEERLKKKIDAEFDEYMERVAFECTDPNL